MNTKFKIGDKVRILNTSTSTCMADIKYYGCTAGHIGIITKIDSEGGYATNEDPRYYGETFNVRGEGLELVETSKELTSLPEKWCIKAKVRSQENAINTYAKSIGGHHWTDANNHAKSYYLFVNNNTYVLGSDTIKDGYTEITFDQFKKWVLDKQQVSISSNDEYLTQSQLVKGEIYTHYNHDKSSRNLIGIYNKDYNWNYYINQSDFSKYANLSASFYFKTATSEEKQWLEACIKANKFISKEESLKSNMKYQFKNGDKVNIPRSKKGDIWYKNNDSSLDNYYLDYFIIRDVSVKDNIGLIRDDNGIFRLNSFDLDDLTPYENNAKPGINTQSFKVELKSSDFDIKQGEGLLGQITFPTWYDSKMVKELFEYDYPLTGEECFKSNNLEFQQPVIIKSNKKSKFKLIVIN